MTKKPSTSLGVLLLAMTIASACSNSPSRTTTIVQQVRSEIRVGMSRAEVEERLPTLPITSVYVPRKDLEMTGETTFDGKPLSGRFDAVTPGEPRLGYMEEAAIYIELDEQERVVNVRVSHIGGGE